MIACSGFTFVILWEGCLDSSIIFRFSFWGRVYPWQQYRRYDFFMGRSSLLAAVYANGLWFISDGLACDGLFSGLQWRTWFWGVFFPSVADSALILVIPWNSRVTASTWLKTERVMMQYGRGYVRSHRTPEGSVIVGPVSCLRLALFSNVFRWKVSVLWTSISDLPFYILLGAGKCRVCRYADHAGCMNARRWMALGNNPIICHIIVLFV